MENSDHLLQIIAHLYIKVSTLIQMMR